MTQEGKRIGRPTKAPVPGKKVSLGLKVTSDIKGRLDQAAQESGRTQSQEAEARLEKSFEQQRLLPQVLELAYGQQLGGILLMLGAILKESGESAAMTAALTHPSKRVADARDWWDSPYGYDQAVRAASQVLEALRPHGQPRSSQPPKHEDGQLELRDLEETVGDRIAKETLEAVAASTPGQRGRNMMLDEQDVRKLLRPLRKRLRESLRPRYGSDNADER